MLYYLWDNYVSLFSQTIRVPVKAEQNENMPEAAGRAHSEWRRETVYQLIFGLGQEILEKKESKGENTEVKIAGARLTDEMKQFCQNLLLRK